MWKKIAAAENQQADLIEELPGIFVLTIFGSPHGSTIAKRRIPTQSRAWPENPNFKLSMQTLLGGMREPLILTCTTACHQRSTARQKKPTTRWIWSPRSRDLPSYGIAKHYKP